MNLRLLIYDFFPAISPSFLTFLLSGLHTESHGFIANRMYDAEHDMFYRMETGGNDSLPFWWNGGIPLWIEATRQVSQHDNTNVVADSIKET